MRFVENKFGKKRVERAAFLFFLISLSACNANRESICLEFPAVADEITGVQAQIAPYVPNRKLASLTPTLPADEMQAKREAWMVWGERALKRTQWAKDALEDDSQGRKAVPALSDAGLALVSFHGFLEQRKWKKATAQLDRVGKSLKQARKVACESKMPRN